MTLELVSTDDLLEELERRYEVIIFAATHPLAGEAEQRIRWGNGDWYRQIGLAFDFAAHVREAMNEGPNLLPPHPG